MQVPTILFLVSLIFMGFSGFFFGPDLSGAFMVSALCAAASLFILGHAGLRRAKRDSRNWVVVDGSNVLYWDGEKPAIATVRAILSSLRQNGFVPVVWFDANVGYLIADRYLDEYRLASLLSLPVKQVFVAPKGTPADPLLLRGAIELGARIVTNDRYRDWQEKFPQVAQPGFLVRGRMLRGGPELELAEAVVA